MGNQCSTNELPDGRGCTGLFEAVCRSHLWPVSCTISAGRGRPGLISVPYSSTAEARA